MTFEREKKESMQHLQKATDFCEKTTPFKTGL